ncbi:FHIP family protein GJ17503-like isoform X2 [Oppia nitens]|uniref:FHIP family protein GJ17503-like isoform X2 n=1 Tax=Oppia nitens TaxID=1686743 RepID=UPI0023DA8A67|nr:FHIP family protein GJ17503-like isoform X2 [Oppia nitens]
MADKRPFFKKLTKIFSTATDGANHAVTTSLDTHREQIDSSAALDSFRAHWSQAYECMSNKILNEVTADDITSVVNHIDQMLTLLLQENDFLSMNTRSKHTTDPTSHIMSPLLDYLLIESILEKVLNWSEMCGAWTQVMALEQLKVYEMLISQICHNSTLFQRPLIRPLLGLLSRFVDKNCHIEVEKRLVVLLNTIFVSLSQNMNLLDLFFLNEPIISSHPETKFLVFSLLIPFVHRDGPVGQQARDSMLLCMAFSRKNESLGRYVAEETDFCPVLATGLSGLYSSLPRRLLMQSIASSDWHQITIEDIQQNPELEVFLNSLEFCNAVAQIAPPIIQNQLLDYFYNGFLVPVIAPALHQNTVEEIIATTAYFDLLIRTISEPNLLKVILKFICTEKYEEQLIINTLITRISAHSKLCLLTLAVFRSLMDLNCEDVLIELIFKYLKIGKHVIGGIEHQKRRINDTNFLNDSAKRFLLLVPICCQSLQEKYNENTKNDNFIHVDNNLDLISQNSSQIDNYDQRSTHEMQYIFNYVDYLNESHNIISKCLRATRCWTCRYEARSYKNANSLLNNNNNNVNNCNTNNISANNCITNNNNINDTNFSHYVPNSDSNDNQSDNEDTEEYLSPIGPFLQSLMSRLEAFCENDVYTNLQITGLVSRLAVFPLPLLRSLLLNPSLIFHKDVKSLLSLLNELRKKLDILSQELPNFDQLMRSGRQFLYSRETRILNRKQSFNQHFDKQIPYNSRPNRSNSINSLSSIRSDVGGEVLKKGFKNFKDLFRSTPKMMRRSTTTQGICQQTPPTILESVSGGQGYRYFKPIESTDQGLDANEIEETERIEKIVLAVIVFEEFVRELSAICCEHYILDSLESISVCE